MDRKINKSCDLHKILISACSADICFLFQTLRAVNSSRPIIHLLPNAHLDPVWLWDWREGLNEGLATVQAVLNLMDEFPQLTFIRGESAIYEHVEKTSPLLFRRIARQVAEGRWDIVGGTHIQPDSNLASTETLCRQFEYGLEYFRSRFDMQPTVAWQADSFGHTPGWPNILHAFGMTDFTFTRPQRGQFPLDTPAFWWEGSHGNRLLCYRQHWPWYCSERANLPEILDLTQKESSRFGFRNIGVLMGLGNHGGGPSRRHILEVEKWRAQHPEIEVRYSTLHGFFRALRSEIDDHPESDVPAVTGDLGYCLRGCYSSVQKFKTLYRQAESAVTEAECTAALVEQAFNAPGRPLQEAWKAVLFNAFHDILPGSSIERAMEEQSAWMGLALHHAQEARFAALNELASRIDTSVAAPALPDHPTAVPMLVWNSQPHPFRGLVEIETSIDYRPIYSYENHSSDVPLSAHDALGRRLPLQSIGTEHTSMPHLPWRKRVLVPLTIPAWGWHVVRFAWDEISRSLPPNGSGGRAGKSGNTGITNGDWTIQAGESLRIERRGQNFWNTGRDISLQVVEDPWGSWGGMNEETDSYQLEKTRETWKLTASEVLEDGPLRARLWTRWQGQNSWITLTFSLEQDSPVVKVEARLLWNERSARLKLVLPCSGDMEFDVPGATIHRETVGQLPSGRWVRRGKGSCIAGFASTALSDVDFTPDELRITLARATRYANDVPTGPEEFPWQPAVDCGELKFAFSLFSEDTVPDAAASTLLHPPVVQMVHAHQGDLASMGSLGQVKPDGIRVLSLQKLPTGEVFARIQNRNGEACHATIEVPGGAGNAHRLLPQEIRTIAIVPTSPIHRAREAAVAAVPAT